MSIKILERLKNQLSSKGNSTDKVENMAINILRKHGILKKDTVELTDYGITRDNMTPSDRAIDRVCKINGRNKNISNWMVYHEDLNFGDFYEKYPLYILGLQCFVHKTI